MSGDDARNLPFSLLEKAAALSGDQLFQSTSPQDVESLVFQRPFGFGMKEKTHI
jgi:hypothetical protein